jgi:hypothetical protein
MGTNRLLKNSAGRRCDQKMLRRAKYQVSGTKWQVTRSMTNYQLPMTNYELRMTNLEPETWNQF